MGLRREPLRPTLEDAATKAAVEAANALPSIVMVEARGSNVLDADGNRYVDLAAGFGALLLGHAHPAVERTLLSQAPRLMQALGDLYPSEQKIELLERLAALYPGRARVIVGQSGSDAVSAALKTARLHTGRPGVLAFSGAYHGLGYGPLAACGLRDSYREPFADQLNRHISRAAYPLNERELGHTLASVDRDLGNGKIGALLVEPILGRGGVVVPPAGFLSELGALAKKHGALLIADEIWTGLGRAGKLLFSLDQVEPDLICLGKGLGGGLPISALVGRDEVLQSWQQNAEVVHTSTFAGAPLACATALTTLDVIEQEALCERATTVGATFCDSLRRLGSDFPKLAVRGAGLMVGLDLGGSGGEGLLLQRRLLTRGYITSTGGGQRDVLVLTPPLNIDAALLDAFVGVLKEELRGLAGTAA